MSLTENFFRTSYSTTVSILTARFGGASIDRAEDAVQYAQLKALRRWRIAGAPERPEAWILRVATNRMLDGYRHDEVIRRAEVSMLEHFGQYPIIVRSSSLLEDGFGNAFAGKYDSFFCVNQGSPEERLSLARHPSIPGPSPCQ